MAQLSLIPNKGNHIESISYFGYGLNAFLSTYVYVAYNPMMQENKYESPEKNNPKLIYILLVSHDAGSAIVFLLPNKGFMVNGLICNLRVRFR